MADSSYLTTILSIHKAIVGQLLCKAVSFDVFDLLRASMSLTYVVLIVTSTMSGGNCLYNVGFPVQ